MMKKVTLLQKITLKKNYLVSKNFKTTSRSTIFVIYLTIYA